MKTRLPGKRFLLGCLLLALLAGCATPTPEPTSTAAPPTPLPTLIPPTATTIPPADTETGLSSGCSTAPPAVPGNTELLLMPVDGLEREYRLHLPAKYDPNTPTSLVLAFHGYGGNARNMESRTWLSSHADKNGYIVVYPQSTSFDSTRGAITSWNDLDMQRLIGTRRPHLLGNFLVAFSARVR